MSNQELAPLVDVLAMQFVQRWDKHARQGANGAYFTVYQPLTRRHLFSHLQGKITLGTYLLDAESRGRFMVFDADDEPDRRRLVALAHVLDELGCPSYLEASRRGGHLWFFFGQSLEGAAIRRFGAGLMAYFNLSTMELYPKQDKLRSGPGSLIRLPFGVHKKDGRRYGFYTPQGAPLAPTLREQIMMLQAPQTVPERLFSHYAEYAAAPAPRPVFEAVDAPGEHVSDRLKAAISCRDFIASYVELTPNGRGKCPFHDDQVASFSVNDAENYWHCFAGCGGGSIIDFWMRWRNTDFLAAINELAEMLLV